MPDTLQQPVYLVPKFVSKEALTYRAALRDLKILFDDIDRAGVAIGKKNLSLNLALCLGDVLRGLSKIESKDAII